MTADDAVPEPEDVPRTDTRRRIRWTAFGVGLVVALVVGVLAAVQLGDPPNPESPLVGKSAPAFDLQALDGQGRIRSDDLEGSVYVVNFWASWCVPCREEAPVLQSFYERWSPRGVVLVGIVYRDSEDAAREFRDEFGLTYPQALDPEFESVLAFGVRGIPETYVVDQRGVVMAHLIGAIREGTLEEVLMQIADGDEVSDSNDRYQRP